MLHVREYIIPRCRRFAKNGENMKSQAPIVSL